VATSGGLTVDNVPGSIPGAGWTTTLWYPTGISASSTGAVANGTLYAYPIFIATPHAFTNIALNVTTAATGPGIVNLGWYNDTGSIYPATLQASVTGLATTAIAIVNSALAFTPRIGLYWLAAAFSGATTTPSITLDTSLSDTFLGGGTANNTAPYRGFVLTGQPAALPATFPAGGGQGAIGYLQVQAA
jgi:hypothetical protein